MLVALTHWYIDTLLGDPSQEKQTHINFHQPVHSDDLFSIGFESTVVSISRGPMLGAKRNDDDDDDVVWKFYRIHANTDTSIINTHQTFLLMPC